ncbi:MAG: hypothetical protein AB4352_19800, partial [Hormoscilla sp.]
IPVLRVRSGAGAIACQLRETGLLGDRTLKGPATGTKPACAGYMTTPLCDRPPVARNRVSEISSNQSAKVEKIFPVSAAGGLQLG